MKLIVAICFIAAVTAAPSMVIKYKDNVRLLRYENKIDADGNYRFSYAQTDGQKRKEEGRVKNAGLENQTIVVTGSYQWVGPDGVKYNVIYVADEDGYQPEISQGAGVVQVSPQIASMLG